MAESLPPKKLLPYPTLMYMKKSGIFVLPLCMQCIGTLEKRNLMHWFSRVNPIKVVSDSCYLHGIYNVIRDKVEEKKNDPKTEILVDGYVDRKNVVIYNSPAIYALKARPSAEQVRRNLLYQLTWIAPEEATRINSQLLVGAYLFKIGIIVDQTGPPLKNKIVMMMIKRGNHKVGEVLIDFVEFPSCVELSSTVGRVKGERMCVVCGSHENIKTCSCSVNYYCSKEHQKEDWPNHRDRCKFIRGIGNFECLRDDFDPPKSIKKETTNEIK